MGLLRPTRHKRRWFFLPLDHTSRVPETRVACTPEQMLRIDGSLATLMDLPEGWQAYRQDPDAEWERKALPKGPTHLVRYEVFPTADHPEIGELGGAFVNCWIRAKTLQHAIAIAESELEESCWRPAEQIQRNKSTQSKSRARKSIRRSASSASTRFKQTAWCWTHTRTRSRTKRTDRGAPRPTSRATDSSDVTD
jgi:hypothetical protein